MDHTIAHTYLHTLLCSSIAHSHPFQITSSAHISRTSGVQSSGQQRPTPPPDAFSLLSVLNQHLAALRNARTRPQQLHTSRKAQHTRTPNVHLRAPDQKRAEQETPTRAHAHTPRPEQREAPTAPPFRRPNAFQLDRTHQPTARPHTTQSAPTDQQRGTKLTTTIRATKFTHTHKLKLKRELFIAQH